MYSTLFSRYNSVIGHNALYCVQRYNCLVQDILYGSVNNIVHKHSSNLVDVSQLNAANFLYELIMIRDSKVRLSNNVDFSKEELEVFINYLCTN